MMNSFFDRHLHLGPTPIHSPTHRAKVEIRDVNFWYGEKQALKNISLDIFHHEVTAFIGPSGCGKTTLLRCLNRTNEIILNTRMTGSIQVDGEDIYAPEVEPALLRQRFGWIAQHPNPFPRSIRDNILYGAKIRGLVSHRSEKEELVGSSLQAVGLWDEVKDKLNIQGTELSIGQQQRLCIARAIATKPEILLMDEPCSALDPIATALVEDLIDELRSKYTVIIITHNMQQAARVSQRVAFFHLGEMLESGNAEDIFLDPQNQQCHDFITGRYG